jgi:hypothetical protein
MDAFELHDRVLSESLHHGVSLDATTLSLIDITFRVLYEQHWGSGTETMQHRATP